MDKNKIALCGVIGGLIIGSITFATSAISFFEIKNQNLISVKGRIVSAVPHVYGVIERTDAMQTKGLKFQFQINNRDLDKPLILRPPRAISSEVYKYLQSRNIGDIMEIYIDADNPTKAYLEPHLYLEGTRSGMVVGGLIIIFALFALRHLILYGVT